MKRHHKITLLSFSVIIGILAGTLTIIEKSIHIINDLKPQASEVPEGKVIEQGVATGIYKVENKQLAKMTKVIK